MGGQPVVGLLVGRVGFLVEGETLAERLLVEGESVSKRLRVVGEHPAERFRAVGLGIEGESSSEGMETEGDFSAIGLAPVTFRLGVGQGSTEPGEQESDGGQLHPLDGGLRLGR